MTHYPAKRGDLALVRSRRSWTMTHGKTTESWVWNFVLVANITRDGVIAGTQEHPTALVNRHTPDESLVCPRDQLRGLPVPDILAALPKQWPDQPYPKDYETVEEARADLLAVLPPESDA